MGAVRVRAGRCGEDVLLEPGRPLKEPTMTNREARERLRAMGWRRLGISFVVVGSFCVAEQRSDGRLCGVSFDPSRGKSLFHNKALWDANRRLIEFVGKHFGEVKG